MDNFIAVPSPRQGDYYDPFLPAEQNRIINTAYAEQIRVNKSVRLNSPLFKKSNPILQNYGEKTEIHRPSIKTYNVQSNISQSNQMVGLSGPDRNVCFKKVD